MREELAVTSGFHNLLNYFSMCVHYPVVKKKNLLIVPESNIL